MPVGYVILANLVVVILAFLIQVVFDSHAPMTGNA